ncbi:hypothetical protein GWK41_07670 [Persephonella atlantica]|uniref:Acylphosphatase-like domain-containing protein n=1 Tax=Persephonella atlantica TaxID=2699429 RepID=A0ABS1GJ42_9AQUI|nr:acylphosphatase [Persephonella atlantica]MBK3332944.1 hypothetical protein [Persephonella atlantica]
MKTAEEIGLRITFEYLNGNDLILELIKQIADRHGIKGYVERKKDTVQIVISAPAEKIQFFSKELGEKMPYSLFMSDATTEAVEGISDYVLDKFEIRGEINILPQNTGICPSCLEELLSGSSRRYHFPFISCNYCGGHYSYLYEYPFEREKTVFKFFQMCPECEEEYKDKHSFRYKYPLTACHSCLTPIYLKKGENERYGFDSEKTVGAFNAASGVIKKGHLLKVYTPNGHKIVGLISRENVEKIRSTKGRKPLTVLFTGVKDLDRYLILSDLEMKALLSQEKPVLKVKPSDDFKEKSLLSDFEFIKVKLPDDPVLALLSFHLKNAGIDYILIENLTDDSSITDFELNADLPVINVQEETEVIVMDRHIIIEKGEKGLLPNIIKSKPTGNLSVAGDYAALDLGNGEYLIDRKEKLLSQLSSFVDSINQLSVLAGETVYVDVPYKEKKEFYSYQGAILSVMAEHRILEEPAVGLYFSHNNDSVIAVKSRTKPLTPLIRLRPVKIFEDFSQTVGWMLNQIEESSEEGRKLIRNFSQKYPHIIEKVSISGDNSYREISDITAVFNAVSIILELFPYDKPSFFEEPYIYLQDMAVNFKGRKGVRIDYILEEENGQFYLNWKKLLQSVISYKLAGAETDMVAFSVLEGFGDWLVSQVATIKSKLKIENTVISGNMFTDPVVTGKLLNFSSKEGKLFISRRLPVDRQNICLGGIFV